MTPVSIIFWTELHAILAEIDGMKAKNQSCQLCGVEPVYTSGDFFKKANELREFAKRQRDVYREE